MTDNEKDRLSKNDLFQIGINLLNRNNQIKNTNAIEYNKLTSYISCGMIFTFLRFKSLFTGIPGWIRWFILLLPFILIGWNLYTYYTAQKALDMSDKHIGEYYLKQNYQHTENREPLNKFKTLNLISQIIFAVSLLCLACLLIFTYYGGQQMADNKTTHTTDIQHSDTVTTDVQNSDREINKNWGVPPETPVVPSDMLPPTSQDPKGGNNPNPPAVEDNKPDNPPEQGEGRGNPK